MSSSSSSTSTTLAVVPNWLGDLVMSLPALDALRHRGRLVAVGPGHLLDLLVDGGCVDAVVPYDRHGRDRGLAGLWRSGRRLAAHAPDLTVAFPPSLRGALLARLSGAPRRRGTGAGTLGARGLLNEVPSRPPDRRRHLADQWLELATGSEPRAGDAIPTYRPGALARAGREGLEQSGVLPSGSELLVLAPGATYGPTKRWPAAGFVEVARGAAARRGWLPVTVGGSDPAERALCDEVAAGAGGVSLAGRTDLPTLAALLAEARAFVGNDSGPMHLAASVGTPTLGIFGSTSPQWTAPRGAWARVCGPHPVPCSPCFRRECPIELPCLRELTKDAVMETLEDLLQHVATANPRGPRPAAEERSS